MMLEKLSKRLGSSLEKIEEFYSEKEGKIWDIVLYGSSMRGEEARDIDILVVFEDVTEEEYNNLPYQLKKRVEKDGVSVDVKGKHVEEIFDPNFLAGGSIVTEGYSVISEEFLAEKLNLDNYTLFNYSLQNLDKNSKTKFTYALKGRGKTPGVLEKIKGKHFAPKVVLVPVQETSDFKTFLERWEISYEEYRITMRKVI